MMIIPAQRYQPQKKAANMTTPLPDQAEAAAQAMQDAAQRMLKNASHDLQDFSEESAGVLAAASKGAARMTERAGATAAQATDDAASFLGDEFRRHPAATFAAILGAAATIISIIIASKWFANGRAR